MSGEKTDEMTLPIALYKHVEHGWIMEARFYGDEDANYHSGYVRISEVETITFRPIADAVVIRNALQMLDATEKKIRLELGERLAALQGMRQNFLALSYQPAPSIGDLPVTPPSAAAADPFDDGIPF